MNAIARPETLRTSVATRVGGPLWVDSEAALSPTSAIIVARETLLRRAIVEILNHQLGFADVEETADLAAAEEAARSRASPLLLIDSCLLPDRRSPASTLIDRDGAECGVVVLADKTLVRYGPQWMARGARAVIDKRVDRTEFVAALGAIRRGERPCRLLSEAHLPIWLDPLRIERRALTLRDRDSDVLRLIAAGFRNQQISDQLRLRPPTVKAYIARSFALLGLTNRTAAAICAHWLLDQGLL